MAFPGSSMFERQAEFNPEPPSTLLDRVETMLQTIRGMPQQDRSANGKELIALPAKKVPLFVPGGLRNQDNLAFALKLSSCATICYIFYHAVDWPGISTSVTTVFFTALGSTGLQTEALVPPAGRGDRWPCFWHWIYGIPVSPDGFHHVAGWVVPKILFSVRRVC